MAGYVPPRYPAPDPDITGGAVVWTCFAVVFLCGIGVGALLFGVLL